MERIFKYETEEVGKIRVIIDDQDIREYTIVSETVYEAVGQGTPITPFVQSVHVALVEGEDEPLVYYKNFDGLNIAVINDSIIDLLAMTISTPVKIHLCLMPGGAIILWSEHSICSTVDMQQLDFHTELNDFLKEFSIIHISERYITLQNNHTGEPEVRKIQTDINLSGEYPVKILISNKKETC